METKLKLALPSQDRFGSGVIFAEVLDVMGQGTVLMIPTDKGPIYVNEEQLKNALTLIDGKKEKKETPIAESWAWYRKTELQLMRPHIVGEDLSGISVNTVDKEKVKEPGGMIARSSYNPNDQWYVNKEFFAKSYAFEKAAA